MYVEGGYVEGGTLGGGGGVSWWWGGLLDVGYVEGVRWGEGVRWRGDVSWAGGVWDLEPGRPLKNRSKTAQILLENRSNRSNLERFFSGISARVVSKFKFSVN